MQDQDEVEAPSTKVTFAHFARGYSTFDVVHCIVTPCFDRDSLPGPEDIDIGQASVSVRVWFKSQSDVLAAMLHISEAFKVHIPYVSMRVQYKDAPYTVEIGQCRMTYFGEDLDPKHADKTRLPSDKRHYLWNIELEALRDRHGHFYTVNTTHEVYNEFASTRLQIQQPSQVGKDSHSSPTKFALD